jgi:hypothetical protein
MRKLKISILILTLSASFFYQPSISRAVGTAEYSAAPVNLIDFKAKISTSVVGVECMNRVDTGIVLSDITLNKSDFDSGVNSFIVTNKDNALKCVSRANREVIIKKDLDTFKANVHGWSSLNSFDIASVLSPLRNAGYPAVVAGVIPKTGWWVGVATYISGFGFSFFEGNVAATNLIDSTLLLTTKTPIVGNGGIVFDNRGRILGIVRTLPNEVIGTYFAVGTPNLCSSGSGSPDSVLNCSLSRAQIWSEIDPPTGSKSVSNEEFLNSVISFIDSSLKQNNTLKGIVSKSKIISKSKKTAYLKIFSKIDSEYKKVDSQIASIRAMSSEEDFRNSTNTLFENWKLWTKDFTKITNEISSKKI